MSNTRVVLVDDHALVRQGVRLILQEEHAIEVVGEAESGEEALQVAVRLTPDVILMDIHMPKGIDGITTARKILQVLPSTRILMLTMYDDEPHIERMLLAGVAGVLFKHDPSTEIIRAIHETETEQPYLPTRISDAMRKRLLDMVQQPKGAPAPLLTPRESEVLTLVAKGFTNREIANQLHISIKTVETHRAHIMERLGATSRAELIQYALNHGLIAPILE